ncbi:MAG: helix-hairpin-helix domain-containing protein [Oscillospiraceae bacterium]|jgi:competence protein ComEA|nr:helix-hairpin-helix domain-containing protein [Oscillospiraceae bacterium]
MDEEKVHIRILIGIAAVLLALCIGYTVLYEPPISDPAAVITTDVSSTPLSSAYNGKIHLNTATEAQLESLKGVGSALAERILSYRKAHGSFHSVAELKNIKGVGNKLYAQLKDQVDL